MLLLGSLLLLGMPVPVTSAVIRLIILFMQFSSFLLITCAVTTLPSEFELAFSVSRPKTRHFQRPSDEFSHYVTQGCSRAWTGVDGGHTIFV